MGDNAGYGITYASPTSGGEFLTRFDTLAPSAAHTEDVTVTLGGGTEATTTRVELHEGGGSKGSWLLLPILGVCALFRRKKSTR